MFKKETLQKRHASLVGKNVELQTFGAHRIKLPLYFRKKRPVVSTGLHVWNFGKETCKFICKNMSSLFWNILKIQSNFPRQSNFDHA